MGKTFRKDSGHNKYARRDQDAKQKFSKKFLQPKRPNSKPVVVDAPPVTDED